MFSNTVREATRRAFLNSFPEYHKGTSYGLHSVLPLVAGDENSKFTLLQ